MTTTEQHDRPLTHVALTDRDFRRAVKVLVSINTVDELPDDTSWTPRQLDKIAKRVKEFAVRRQVAMAAQVVRSINRHHGAGDDDGYPHHSLAAIADDPAFFGFALLDDSDVDDDPIPDAAAYRR